MFLEDCVLRELLELLEPLELFVLLEPLDVLDTLLPFEAREGERDGLLSLPLPLAWCLGCLSFDRPLSFGRLDGDLSPFAPFLDFGFSVLRSLAL